MGTAVTGEEGDDGAATRRVGRWLGVGEVEISDLKRNSTRGFRGLEMASLMEYLIVSEVPVSGGFGYVVRAELNTHRV
ncbi:hypothetical protein PIB30_000541 [Stylosanthes scabra]|uniref:Uncharacterized protein n=1 Tax=Stylosanthes scabra TaxID=79078 RepID=A0ABU6W260_9FABA|nr:hypothetical protein [Stylosanthes scabra]